MREKRIIDGVSVETAVFGNGPMIFMPVSPSGSTERIANYVTRLTGEPFTLCGFDAGDWNVALTPWQAENPFGGTFSGGAEKTLRWLEEFAVQCTSRKKYISGYSLGGLFAVWALTKSSLFSGCACCSGSLWYPGIKDYLNRWSFASGRKMYFSLGDKEPRTRNPVLSSIGKETEAIISGMRVKGAETVLEWNPGNHFQDSDLRTAKGIAWLIERKDA